MERVREGANYCERINARREEGRGIYCSLWGILPQRCLTHKLPRRLYLTSHRLLQRGTYHAIRPIPNDRPDQPPPLYKIRAVPQSITHHRSRCCATHPPTNLIACQALTTPLADLPTGQYASRSTAWCWFVGMGDADAVRVMRLRGCVVGWYGGGAWWEARWKGDRRLGARW